MGKGDRKSRRGKIVIGSYGVRRRRKKSMIPAVSAEKVTKKKGEKDTKPVKEKESTGSAAVMKDNGPAKAKTTKTATEKKEVSEVKADKTEKKQKAAKTVKASGKAKTTKTAADSKTSRKEGE